MVKELLRQKDWLLNAFVIIDYKEKIRHISVSEICDEYIDNYVLPGFQNTQSQAFQYAMSGLTEIRYYQSRKDNFWAWRDAMYQGLYQLILNN